LPNLINLNLAALEITQRAVLIIGSRNANVFDELQNCVLGHSSHALNGANRVPFYQSCD
jgi:hypothetical protein